MRRWRTCGGGLVLCNDARTGLTCSTVGDVSAETCNGADDDCNGVIDNGFNLSTDEANCGACGVTCTNAHGNTQCADGICIPSCDPLWGDCANPNDGCETQLTSVNNCGACGFVCDLPNAVELCTRMAFVALRRAIRAGQIAMALQATAVSLTSTGT